MKKRNLFLIAISIIIVSLFVSCSADGDGDGLAYAVLSITNDRARTISSGNDSLEITKYYVKLSPTSLDKEYEFTFDKNDSGTYNISGVIPGSYNVEVEARTKNNTVVSKGSTSHRFTRGALKTFSVTLNTLYGSQDTTITYTWNTDVYSADAKLKLIITDEKGNSVSTDNCITSSSGQAVFKKNLPAGSYIFISKLYEGDYIVLGYTDVVRVTNGSALTHTINLTSFGAASGVNTASINSSDLYVPLTGTLDLYAVKTYAGATLTLTNLPDGITADDVMISWYVEDMLVTTDSGKGKTTATFQPMGPTTIVTAVMQCSKIGSMGSVTGVYIEE